MAGSKVYENYSSRDGSISFQLDTTGSLGLAKCGVLFKMVLLLVLMLEITHTLPVLKPEAPFSRSTAHALLRRTLKYTKHFCRSRVF